MGGVILILVMVVVVVLLVLRRREEEEERVMSREENIKRLADTRDELFSSIVAGGEPFGITPEDAADILPRDPNKICVVYPINGACDSNFYDLKDGCCELRDSSSEEAKKAYIKAVKQLCLEIGVGVIADQVLTNILPRIINGEIGTQVALKIKSFIDDGMRASAKTFGKILAGIIRRIAQSMMTRMLVTGVSKLMVMMAKLGSGPVGWAMLALDAFTIVLSIADNENFDSWVENKAFIKMRNALVYRHYTEVKKSGFEYPVLFPIDALYKDALEAAQVSVSALTMKESFQELETLTGGKDLVMNIFIAHINNTTHDYTEKDTDLLIKAQQMVREKDPVKEDKMLYTELLTSMDEGERKNIVLIPSMSGKKSIGISVTEATANKWNADNKENWFNYYDIFYPPNNPSDLSVAFVAVYTDKYLTINDLNPGTANNPNIISKPLPQKMTIMYPMGMLVSHCEKPRTTNRYKTPIDPREHGVTYDIQNLVCNFTDDYCKRYGLITKNKTLGETAYVDCVKRPGQAAAEVIVGPQLTRGVSTEWEKRIDGFNSGNPKTIALTVAAIVSDPSGVGTTLTTMAEDARKRRSEEYDKETAITLNIFDPTGGIEGFVRNMDEKAAGRFKYCETGDTCKSFTVKHNGGNFMHLSARDKYGGIYSNGQGFQDQVKDSEEHVFVLPEDGYFKISCNPGESKNIPYAEIPPSPFNVSCAYGKVGINKSRADQAKDTTTGILSDAAGGLADAGGALVGAGSTAGGALADAGSAVGGALEPVGDIVETIFNPTKWF